MLQIYFFQLTRITFFFYFRDNFILVHTPRVHILNECLGLDCYIFCVSHKVLKVDIPGYFVNFACLKFYSTFSCRFSSYTGLSQFLLLDFCFICLSLLLCHLFQRVSLCLSSVRLFILHACCFVETLKAWCYSGSLQSSF